MPVYLISMAVIIKVTIFSMMRVRIIVFNATFNNISAVYWRSVLLVEETRIPRENHRPVASYWQALSHNAVSSTPRHEGIRTLNFSVDR